MLLINEVIPWSYDKDEDIIEIVKSLSDWNCCLKCILRLLCVKDHNYFQLFTAENLADWLLFSEDDEKIFVEKCNENNNIVCVACLEILQDKFSSEQFILEIVDNVKNQGYEFNDFFCAITLPVNIQIREQSIMIALMDKFPDIFDSIDCKSRFTSIKDAWKWMNGLKLSEVLGIPFSQRSSFEIQLFFEHKHDENECQVLAENTEDFRRRRKYCKINRNNMSRILKDIPTEEFRKTCKIPMTSTDNGCHCEVIQCAREAVFVAGRYNKYSRTLSQTPWFIEGAKKYEDSVEEIICKKVVERFSGKEHRFSSSGREDVDVRMLGRGRPFLIEIVDPKKFRAEACDLRQVEDMINKSTNAVFVRDLQIVSKEDTKHLKEGEEEKTKNYKALCLLKASISDDKLFNLSQVNNLELAQKTPIRVLHRRPLATRSRTIYKMSAVRMSENLIMLNLSTQAGTYIKEFVHGDFGRTAPSLKDLLGCECDILQLDVSDVLLDWPPSIDYKIN